MTYGFIFQASSLFLRTKFYLSGAYAARFSATRHGRKTLAVSQKNSTGERLVKIHILAK
jgi:hypothetical protein